MNNHSSRSMRVAPYVLGICAMVFAWPQGSLGNDRPAADPPAESVKRILVYENSQKLAAPALRWFLYDPLIVSQTRIVVESRTLATRTKHPGVDFSARALEPYDLVIVAQPLRLDKPTCLDLLHYLDRGGALLLVQPNFADSDLATAWEQHTGIGLRGYEKPTPAFSVTSSHPGARILGLPEGRSVLPHRRDAPHAKLVAPKAIVLTEFAGDDPELVLSSQARCGLLGTDLLADLDTYRRGDPAAAEYQRHAGLLLVNAVRHLLGYPLFEQPVQTSQQQWCELFQGYGAGREYAVALQQIEPFRARLSVEEFSPKLEKADAKLTVAARALLRGEPGQCDACYREAATMLAQLVQQMVHVNRFLIRGWHASTATDEYYGGGTLGYAEMEWSDHLLHWMRGGLDLIQRADARRLLDIYAHDWEILAKYYPRDIAVLREAVRQGYLEPVHGLYTAAYLPLFSEESNVRQLLYGTEIIRKTLGVAVVGYTDPHDHYDLHPQLPQLLVNFGFRYAYLNGGSMLGVSAPIRADKIGWQGLDGTILPAVPRCEGLEKTEEFTRPDLIAQADKLGYRNVLLGWTVDATFNHATEQPHTLLDGVAPVSGKWVTLGEYFQSTPPAETSRFLGVDELHANNLEMWSSWGCMNEAYAWNRDTENLLLAAERFHAVACGRRLVPSKAQTELQNALGEAWKNLLATQDHMTFGAVDYSRQVPPAINPSDKERPTWHAWGYGFPPLSRAVSNIGGMESYGEEGTANYGGPRIPTTRYAKVQQYHQLSRTHAQGVLDDALARLVNSDGPAWDRQARMVCLFNPLGAARHDLVTIEAALPLQWAQGVQLRDGNGPIEFQTIASETRADGSLKSLKLLVPADVPPLGYKTLALMPAAPPAVVAPSMLTATPLRLEGPFYVVELDGKHGGIRRIFDKQLSREMLATGEVFGNELWSPENPRESSTHSTADVRVVETGPLRATVVVRSTIGHLPYECAISLYRDLKRIDFKLAVDYGSGFAFGQFGKSGTGLFVHFPTALDGKMFINQPFGIYETAAAKQVTGDFAALDQNGFGLAIIHRNTPCVFRDGRVLRLILSQGQPLVVGRQNYEYSLVSYAHDVHHADVYGTAQAINTPLRVFWPPAGASPRAQDSFMAIDRPDVKLSALLMAGSTIQARFFETAGQAVRTTVRLPFPLTDCMQIKLNGEKVRTLAGDGDQVKLDFRPWEIVTLSVANP